MLKNMKICSNFAVGGHFWHQWTIYPSPPSPDSVLDTSPPSDSVTLSGTENHPRKQVPPTKTFVKKPCQTVPQGQYNLSGLKFHVFPPPP